MNTIPPEIYDLDAQVVFVPVRHHSPACARVVRELAQAMRPAAVLIEGPSDFNAQMGELTLPHTLPIAIYSYVRLEGNIRRGAFYPFCVYSPEWQAIQTGRELGAEVRFIDLPWAAMADPTQAAHRYADGELRTSPYIPMLCRELGVENFDDAWDTLFEIGDLSTADYLQRGHYFCGSLRLSEPQIREIDLRREAHMAAMIRAAMDEFEGRILVITGGFHSLGLFERLANGDCAMPEMPPPPEERGIALTPYSYERLDSLRGYESGMPNPGFYQHIWDSGTYRGLLARVAQRLREKNQRVSAADLIAVETSAQALGILRGHARVWRRDLIDGVISALVKDELAFDLRHPFLEAVFEVFRGSARGHLAEGTTLPSLVIQLQQQLATYGLQPETEPRDIMLDFAKAGDLERSRILHQVRILGLPDYTRTSASDITDERITEVWRIVWSPEFEGACIEAAIYGATLEDAARARLYEQAAQIEQPDASEASRLLLDAALIGLPGTAAEFYSRLATLITQDGNFFTTSQALANLLYLYRFDAVLGTMRHADVGELLRTAFRRSLWLLETLGAVTGQDQALLDGIRALLETFERCAPVLNMDREDFTDIFRRTANDVEQTPLMRGAATGILWTLGGMQVNLQSFTQPEQLGDFLTGLFYLAREVIQREAALIGQIDSTLLRYDEDGFLAALPSLRLAFSFFLPREKYYLLRTLFGNAADALPELEVNINQAAQVLAFENALFKALEKYGIAAHG
jgi:Family of unknown function (DUF5682)